MSFEHVEFTLNPPIEGNVGSIPYGIELKGDNGIITGLWVIIGDDLENEIEASPRFSELFAKGGNYNGSLSAAVKEYGIQRAQNYLDRLNFARDSHTFELGDSALVTLIPTGQLQRQCGVSFTMDCIVGDDFGLDVSRTYDEDDFLNRLYFNYDLGMKTQQQGNLVSAYQCFYAVLPIERGSSYQITNSSDLNLNLKIIIAYFNPSIPRHMDLIRNNIHYVRNAAKSYIDRYMMSGRAAT